MVTHSESQDSQTTITVHSVNPDAPLASLSQHPFGRLAALLAPIPRADQTPIDLSIGEPKHSAPALLMQSLLAHGEDWNRYPPILGTADFRDAAAGWLARRYELPQASLDQDNTVMPVSGSREALFLTIAHTVAACRTRVAQPKVLIPNPFYAVYEGAAVAAGAEPVYIGGPGGLPDFGAWEGDWDDVAAMILCSPSNPQGSIAWIADLRAAVTLARQHGCLLIVDECYADIYDQTPPPGILAATQGFDGGGMENVLAFHSLSKRSNVAGLRSGFMTGDRRWIAALKDQRLYAAAAMPLPLMAASAALWRDDKHVIANRAQYRAKFDLVEQKLGGRFDIKRPPGGFFLWPQVRDPLAVTQALWARAAIKVIPGDYFARTDARGVNPGADRIRIALVHDLPTLNDALARLGPILEETRL